MAPQANGSEAIVLLDARGWITYATPSVTHLLGYPSAELVGRDLAPLLHPDDRDYASTWWAELIKAPGQVSVVEVRCQHQNRGWVCLDLTAANLLTEPGLQAVVVNFRDKTLWKQMEVRLQGFQADLERRVAERTTELMESEERFRRLFENLSEAVFLIDPHSVEVSWAILDCNQTACRMNGYAREELIGRSIDILHPEPPLEQRQTVWHHLQHVGPLSLERYHRHKDGHLFLIEVSISLVRMAGRDIVLGVDRDITARKQAEDTLAARTAELEDTAQFLTVLLEMAPVGLFVKEAENLRFARWNRANEAIIGLTAAEVLGKTDYDFFPKQEADYFVAIDRGVLASPAVLDVPEEQVHTTHAGVRTLHTRKVRILGADGRPKYLLGVSEDITERKRSEAALRRAAADTEVTSAILRSLNATPDVTGAFSGVADGLRIITGCERVSLIVLDEDRQWFTITALDRPRSELGLKAHFRLTDTSAASDILAGRPHLTLSLRAEGDYPIEQQLLLAGYEARLVLPLSLGGQVLGSLNLAWLAPIQPADLPLSRLYQITDAVALAMERSRLWVETQQRAAELESANHELEAFSYSVSHDLRAPLRSINGFSHVLMEAYGATLPEEGQQYLQRVMGAGERMTQLIDDLLRLSRVTRTELQSELVDLSATARDIFVGLRAESGSRHVEEVVADDLTVWGDAQLLRVALENLIGNAWKFTRQQPLARIEFGRTADAQAAFFVRDNGAGFDMTYAHKLFGAFQRLHTETEFPGTGIGLAIVRRVIHRHGGRVWAESAPGQGASFFFTLP
jgi:PAS domain S-box-containing protein